MLDGEVDRLSSRQMQRKVAYEPCVSQSVTTFVKVPGHGRRR